MRRGQRSGCVSRFPERPCGLGQRPLTIEIQRKYDRDDPSPRVPQMPNRSEIVVPRSVHAGAYRVGVLWLTAAFCVLAAGRPARAAGCTAHERPVMNFALSWEADQTTELSPSELIRVPPILTHLPCGGELPIAPGSSLLPAVAALIGDSALTRPDDCGLLFSHISTDHCQPTSLRLDRPPRPTCASHP
jgi:hypothetical protein